MKEASAARTGAGFDLDVLDNTRYGALCDAKNHYFHKVGCAPVFRDSRQCGSCHLYYERAEGGADLPVFTEYEEWEASLAGSISETCQDCHMPATAEEAAVGAGVRPGVAHHGFMGPPSLHEHALGWRVTATGGSGVLHVQVELKNEKAGHAVPTGMPGRRVVLRVRVTAGGKTLDAAERVYARVLVDEGGAEVPFYRAVRVASDRRIAAGAAAKEAFDLQAPDAPGELEVTVVRAEMSSTVSAAVGLPLPVETVVLATRIPFGRSTASGREKLPRSVSASP